MQIKEIKLALLYSTNTSSTFLELDIFLIKCIQDKHLIKFIN